MGSSAVYDDDVEVCPLITPYTREVGLPDALMEQLYRIRTWDIREDNPIPFKWPIALRKTIWDVIRGRDTGEPLIPKQYQIQMAQVLSRMIRFIDGDSVGLGKTLTAMISMCWLHQRLPRLKVIVFTTKSTTGQWADEFGRFTTLRPTIMKDKHGKLKSYPARFAQLQEFLTTDNHDILICKYSSMVGKRKKVDGKYDEDGYPTVYGRERIASEVKEFLKIIKPHGKEILMVTDECQKYKTLGGATRNMIHILAKPCARVWPLTATIIKNTLEEMYSIASAVGIRPFGSPAEFLTEFCIMRTVHYGGGKQEEVIVGYKNVARFKAGMRPFFLGRSQRQVKEKLPRLTTTIHPIDLDEEQTRLLLKDIPSGAYRLPPKLVKTRDGMVLRDRDASNEMTLLSVFQLVANHPGLLDPSNKKEFLTRSLSPKEEALLDMLDGDYRGEKCVIYTKSKSWIDRLEHLTKEGAFTDRKFLRITGAESEDERNAAKRLFQDPEGDHDVIFINDAATEGVNLQQANHLICLDVPWSWGAMMQLVGRMLRMASPHSACTLHIMAARGSVDEYAIETLKGKKTLFEKILGESHSAGLLDDREFYDLESGMEQTPASDTEFLSLLKAHIKDVALTSFTKGLKLQSAQGDDTYKMAFEPGAKKKPVRAALDADFEDQERRWGGID